MKGSRHEGGTPTGGRISGGGKGKLPQNLLSRLDTLGCASVVVVEAKGAPPPHPRGANVWQLKSTPSRFHLPLCHRRQPPSSSEAPRRGKNFLGVGWVGGRAVSCSFREESRCPYFSNPSLRCPLTPTIILGSRHKNRGNKDPFSPTGPARRGGGGGREG